MSSSRPWLVRAFVAAVSLNSSVVFAQTGAIAGLVRAGLGCALMPRLATAGLDDGLVAMPWEGGHAAVALDRHADSYRRRDLRPARGADGAALHEEPHSVGRTAGDARDKWVLREL